MPFARGTRYGLLSRGRSSLLNSLVAYYKFGDALDSHTNALNLTEVNSPTYVSGQVGNCVNLVGASSQYLSSASGLFAVGANSAWWSMWIRFTTTTGYQAVVSKHALAGGQWGYAVYASGGVPRIGISSDGAAWATAVGGAITVATWAHLYCQFDATSRKAGISVNNGALSESAAVAAGQIHTSTDPFRIGYNPELPAPQYFDGRIDELAFGVGAVLTATQRTNLYTAQLAGDGSYPFVGIP